MYNIVFIAASLDGFIARENGDIDWLTENPDPADTDYGFGELMERIDAIIMGRKTFEVLLGFDQWPYTKPIYVLSRTMKSLPDRLPGRAEIIRGELKEILSALEERGRRNFYVDGGVTIQSFLRQDLIDEMIITRVPVLLGSGIPLFSKIGRDLKFEHLQTETFENGLVKSRYRRLR